MEQPAPRKRPVRFAARMCTTCAQRELRHHDISENVWGATLHVFQLKLRDWFGVEKVTLVPCLSVCPEKGISVERRGTSMVLDERAIGLVQSQFDPTRQLSLFGEELPADVV